MDERMTVSDALAILAPRLRDEVCICSNGFMSRAAYGARDGDACFYMIGSMGLAASIGLGVAKAKPDRRVIVFDGDGNVLMNLGTLATIAAAAPRNLVHLCFDNGVHASTGAQPTVSDRVRLEELARAAGYRFAARVESRAALVETLPVVLAGAGPAFLLVRVALGPPGPPGPRIPFTPVEMTARTRHALGSRS
jgi:thiamine pyrophosphate-dependent acetolactate synthase large subunit-like protein